MRIVSILLLLPVLLLVQPSAQAQTSLYTYNKGGTELGVSVLKPSFEEDADISFFSTTWYLSGRFPVGVNVAIISDIPIAFISEGQEGNESEFMIGNPFLGIEFDRPVSPVYAHFGVRLPLANENNPSAALFGIFSDYDNFSAFAFDAIPVILRAGRRDVTQTGFYSNVLVGAEAVFFTESDTDSELLLTYQGLFGYDNGSFRFSAGFSGLVLATESDGDFGERSIHHLLLQANGVMNQFRPGIIVRVPVDEQFEDLINFIFGLTLSVDLNG